MNLPRLLFELASLKNIPRSGWFKLNVRDPESVAEHSFLTGVIAFFIGLKEYGDVNEAAKACAAALFHDIHEARTLDLHKLARRYVKVDESRVIDEQLNFDEGFVVKELIEKYSDIVKDADKIELFIQSRIYSDFNKDCEIYGRNIELRTETGKKLIEELKNTDHRWWLDFEVLR